MSDAEVTKVGIPAEQKGELVEEVITEISVYLGLLYHLIEALKGHEDFADELSVLLMPFPCLVIASNSSTMFTVNLEPPLPVYFYTLVSGVRDRSPKGYPVKKVSPLFPKRIETTVAQSAHTLDSSFLSSGKRYSAA